MFIHRSPTFGGCQGQVSFIDWLDHVPFMHIITERMIDYRLCMCVFQLQLLKGCNAMTINSFYRLIIL